MLNGKNVEKCLDLPMSTSTSMCPCPCPSAHVHVHVHVSLYVSVSPWDTDTDRDTWTWTWADFSSKNFHEFIIHMCTVMPNRFFFLQKNNIILNIHISPYIFDIKNQKYLHIFFLPYFHSTFCPIRRFFIQHFVPFSYFSIRHFVPFGVFPFDVLSRSAFFPFDVFSIRCFVPFGLLSHSTLVPFDILSHSAFFPFDVLSHSAFWLSTLCCSTFCPFGVCYFDILSVNRKDGSGINDSGSTTLHSEASADCYKDTQICAGNT
jgi:hypothetical protein